MQYGRERFSPLLAADRLRKSFSALYVVTSSSANKQLRHLRILIVHCYEKDIFRALERIPVSNFNNQPWLFQLDKYIKKNLIRICDSHYNWWSISWIVFCSSKPVFLLLHTVSANQNRVFYYCTMCLLIKTGFPFAAHSVC